MMNPDQDVNARGKVMWLGLGLAALAALSYVLMAIGVLGAGDAEGPPFIVYTAATCYLVGGVLILTRRRGLWIAGAVINALILVFWFQAYQARPAVLLSSGGIVSKTAQVLLELCLLYLLLGDWLRRRTPSTPPNRLTAH
jgi:hypothetical protein